MKEFSTIGRIFAQRESGAYGPCERRFTRGAHPAEKHKYSCGPKVLWVVLNDRSRAPQQ